MKNHDAVWMKISKKTIVWIMVYYILIYILGLFSSILSIIPNSILSEQYDTITLALIGSLGASGIGSSIYYTRKLYKSCIQKKINTPSSNRSEKHQELGAIIYFIIRPIFALGFSILVVAGLNAGMLSMADSPVNLSSGFVKVCMFISFFFGFSSGKLIEALEKKGKSLIPSLFSVSTEDQDAEK